MIQILLTSDPVQIKAILSTDNMFGDIKEDPNLKEPIINETMLYCPIVETADDIWAKPDLVGLMLGQWLGNNLITWHGVLRPKYRGLNSAKYGQANQEFIRETFPGVKHISLVPAYNKPAIGYTLKLGFKQKYVLKDACKHEGKLYDKILMEIE